MHNILAKIIAQKRKDLIAEKRSNFKTVILKASDTAIIGELKFASPKDQNIGSPAVLLTQARNYETAGLTAISIITEKHFFKGNISFILQVKQIIKIPILFKDFIIDESQIYQAKAVGSDAILLITRIVEKATLQRFVLIAKKIGIEPVVELADDEDLEKALSSRVDIIAVNARDLDTFEVNVNKACQLLEKIP